jgi:hypothetical protein
LGLPPKERRHIPGAKAHFVATLEIWAKAQTYPEAKATAKKQRNAQIEAEQQHQ